jgi:thiosulfate dehydrogenase (quinone) large subunit
MVGGAATNTPGSKALTGGGATPATASVSSTTSGTGATTTTAAAAEPSGTAVGPASDVPVGGSASFTDPASGDPALVIQQTAGDFVAFDAVCPHAGCTVAYQAAARVIACPCHGSAFNARTGDVLNGPATSGLTSIKVTKGANGNLYVPK